MTNRLEPEEMRSVGFLVFIGIFLAIDGAAHWYLYLRLFRDPSWPPWVRLVGGGVLAFLAVAMLLTLIFFRTLSEGSLRVVFTGMFIWMGTAFYFLILLGLVDLARALAAGAASLMSAFGGTPPAMDPERRRLIHDGAANIAGIAAVGASALALRSGLGEVEVPEIGIELDRLPKTLSGLTIVQLSDVHVGPTIRRRFVESIVEKANRARPDIVVITGDLVDGSVEELEAHVAPLAGLSARFGVYFVTGNHEYYSGANAWMKHLPKLGIRVLSNERVEVGDAGGRFDLAGIDDVSAGRFDRTGAAAVRAAVERRDPDRELVLLSHQPKAVSEAASAGAGLVLSGHTHGGQIFPFGALVALTQPYLAGLHRHDARTQIYVSRGTGYWGPPMRLLAPAEVTKIVLGSKA